MNKYIKVSLLLIFTCFSCFLIHENVHAASFSTAPYFGYNYVNLNGTLTPAGGQIYSSTIDNRSVYLSDQTFYSYFGSTDPLPEFLRFWWNKNLNLCDGGSTILKGSFFMELGNDFSSFKPYVSISTNTYANRKMCSFTKSAYNQIDFSCSISNWSNATALNVYLEFNDIPIIQKKIFIGLSKNLEYSCDIQTSDIINNNNQNTQNIINNQNKNNKETNDNLNKIDDSINKTNDYLKDDTPPKSDISSLGNVQGLFPPGPVDSLLNIPFEFLSILTSSFSETCVDMSFNFVFNQRFTIPCFDSIYDEMSPALLILVDTIPAAFILIKYFKYLYKKVDRATSLETTDEDEWGVL